MSSGEREPRMVKSRNNLERDPSHYFHIENKGKTVLEIGLRPDAFVITWPTHSSVDEFFAKACAMNEALQAKGAPPRETPKTNPAEAIIIGEGETYISPSYAGLSVQDDGTILERFLIMPIENYRNLPFRLPLDQFPWPLTITGIHKTLEDIVHKLGWDESSREELKKELDINPNETYIRMDTQYASMHFGQDRWPRSLMYWSHIYPPDDLSKLYQETAVHPIQQEDFIQMIDHVISPYIGKYYSQV